MVASRPSEKATRLPSGGRELVISDDRFDAAVGPAGQRLEPLRGDDQKKKTGRGNLRQPRESVTVPTTSPTAWSTPAGAGRCPPQRHAPERRVAASSATAGVSRLRNSAATVIGPEKKRSNTGAQLGERERLAFPVSAG